MYTSQSPKIKLSILDIATITNGKNANQTLQDSTDLIKLVDELGYTRYWFAEHHNVKTQVSTSPELMIAHAAAHTKRIRVGAGGVMLPNHSPLKVAENFLTLESLNPGRIDLGMGRAPGTDGLTAYALRRSREAVTSYDFPEQLAQTLSFLSKDFAEDHPFHKIIPLAGDPPVPNIYMLGSSNGGVQFALQHGLGFVFAAHLAPHLAIPMLRAYREKFKPSRFFSQPNSILSIIVITAETNEEAQYLAGPVELYWVRLSMGIIDMPFPTLEEASSYIYSSTEETIKKQNKDKFVIGSVSKVTKKLRDLAEQAHVDEIMIMEYYPDKESRHKAYQLLATEFLHKNI